MMPVLDALLGGFERPVVATSFEGSEISDHLSAGSGPAAPPLMRADTSGFLMLEPNSHRGGRIVCAMSAQ